MTSGVKKPVVAKRPTPGPEPLLVIDAKRFRRIGSDRFITQRSELPTIHILIDDGDDVAYSQLTDEYWVMPPD